MGIDIGYVKAGLFDLPDPKAGRMVTLLRAWHADFPPQMKDSAQTLATFYGLIGGPLFTGKEVLQRPLGSTLDLDRLLNVFRGHLVPEGKLAELVKFFQRDLAELDALKAAHAADMTAWQDSLRDRMLAATSTNQFQGPLALANGFRHASEMVADIYDCAPPEKKGELSLSTFSNRARRELEKGIVSEDMEGAVASYCPDDETKAHWQKLASAKRNEMVAQGANLAELLPGPWKEKRSHAAELRAERLAQQHIEESRHSFFTTVKAICGSLQMDYDRTMQQATGYVPPRFSLDSSNWKMPEHISGEQLEKLIELLKKEADQVNSRLWESPRNVRLDGAEKSIVGAERALRTLFTAGKVEATKGPAISS